MEERKGLYSSLGKIAWGYALIYLYFNINTIDLLPDWAGWLLIYSALPGLAGAGEPSALLLRPLCGLLAAWEGLCWVLTAVGEPTELWGLWLIAAVLTLYVHFQLFKNLASAAERFGCPQRRGLLVLRTMNVVFTTLLSLPLPLDEGDTWFIWPFLALTLVVIVWTIAALTGFRGSLRDGMGEEPAQ